MLIMVLNSLLVAGVEGHLVVGWKGRDCLGLLGRGLIEAQKRVEGGLFLVSCDAQGHGAVADLLVHELD